MSEERIEKNVMEVNCDVICDLMVVYASGEASQETAAFIEAHLDDCPECQEAFEAAKRGEDLLSELEPVERPINIDGRKILMRVQRIFFAVAAFILLAAGLVIAFAERVVLHDFLGFGLFQFYVLGNPFGGPAGYALTLAIPLVVFAVFSYWRTVRAEDSGSAYMAMIGSVLLFAIGMASYSLMVEAGAGGVLVGGTLMFALYILMLRWRAQWKPGRFAHEFLLSVEAAVPLLFLVISSFTLLSTASFTAGLIAFFLLGVALVFTIIQLAELPFMTLIGLLSLLFGGVMLVGNVVFGFFDMFDVAPEFPADLGHPDEAAAAIDLTSLGYALQERGEITVYGELELVEETTAFQSVYTRPGGGTAYVTVLEFADDDSAASFFREWENLNRTDFYQVHLDLNSSEFDEPDGHSEHPLNWDLELPGVWFGQEGQIARSYDETTLSAYNAWQLDEWVTIVEVQGAVGQALPMAKQIKEAVVELYQP